MVGSLLSLSRCVNRTNAETNIYLLARLVIKTDTLFTCADILFTNLQAIVDSSVTSLLFQIKIRSSVF